MQAHLDDINARLDPHERTRLPGAAQDAVDRGQRLSHATLRSSATASREIYGPRFEEWVRRPGKHRFAD